MRTRYRMRYLATIAGVLLVSAVLSPRPASALLPASCDDIKGLLPNDSWQDVRDALRVAVSGNPAGTANDASLNGGVDGIGQWVSVVNRDGEVCAVFFSGVDRDDQWPASRVIAMQKAYTANSLSLDGLALSTANLWAATQPGGSLYGLQFSNPVDHDEAYAGPASDFGTGAVDPAAGTRVGGVNVFGGGLGLYSGAGVVGGIGTSGNTSCADHIITWKIRNLLGLDNVPGGVADGGATDNIIFDVQANAAIQNRGGNAVFRQPNLPQTVSASGFGHPECGFGERPVAEALPMDHPLDGGPQL